MRTTSRPVRRVVLACLCAAALACGDDPLAVLAGAPPVLASPNVAVGATVGEPVSYDATKGGTAFASAGTTSGRGPLRYRITFEGGSNGLSASGGTVTGRPLTTSVTWATIVATDLRGRTASDRFAIVAFAPELLVPALPATPYRYAGVPLPAHFAATIGGASAAATDNTPADNPVTDAGAALGRVLFYDPRLSANDALSCAGCHDRRLGFSDRYQRSIGFAGGLTARRAPSLVNARFYQRGRFFWDERAATLEAQVLGPIQDGVEMGVSLESLVAKLGVTPYYPSLFAAAFGTPEVTSDRVARALAQFVRSMVSAGSRYDAAFTAPGASPDAPDFAAVFTPEELEGERLFRSAGCASCHATVAHVSRSVHNIGLDAASADTGAGGGAFKAPSLRNVALRPLFMHDGRFTTLEQVVEFFDSGVQPNPDLDPRLRAADGSPKRLGLTAAQRAALVAYLETLTDSAFLADPRFASPFAPAPPPGTAAVQATRSPPRR